MQRIPLIWVFFLFLLPEMSFIMGTFSDLRHTHPGISYWSCPPPPPGWILPRRYNRCGSRASDLGGRAANPTHIFTNLFTLKPIFHCDAKPFALGTGVGLDPQCHNFALPIPTCWYLKTQNLRYPQRKF